jgi:hypothetical protein
MMGPGDEVICVGTPCVCKCGSLEPDRAHGHPDYRDPVEGQHYVVGKIGGGWCEGCATPVPCLSPVGREKLGCPPPYSWPMIWFRPLEYEEDAVVVRAGVTLPVKVPA